MSFNERIKGLSDLFIDDKRKDWFQFISVNVIFGLVAFFMTVLNITQGGPALASLSFVAMCIINVVLTHINDSCFKVARVLFAVQVFILFGYFIVSGNPDGFSCNWMILLPIFGMIVFHKRFGSILGMLGFIMLAFFFYTPFGQDLLKYDYLETYMLRFPIFYLASFICAYFFESVRVVTHDKLVALQEEYKNLYRKDALTGVSNRYGFDADVKKIVADKDLNINQMVFLIFDIDFFKSINDTYGHDVGDKVLIESVNKISKITGGKVCRWGGEEFALLMTNRSLSADDIAGYCKDFAKEAIHIDSLTIEVTVSVGAVIVEGNSVPSIDKLYREADECLYLAKQSGRNRAITKKYD